MAGAEKASLPRPDLKAAMRAALEKKQRAREDKPEVPSAGTAEVSAVSLADTLRQEGNRLFAANDLPAAEERYRRALSLGPQLSSQTRTTLWSNLALLRIATSSWSEARDFATRALEEDPGNVKAQYRRALCAVELGELDQATRDVTVVLKSLDASSQEGKQALDLQARIQQAWRAESSGSWELVPAGQSPAEAETAVVLRSAYALPEKAHREYDSTTSIPQQSDYFRVADAPGKYVRAPVEALAVEPEPVCLENLPVEQAWPGDGVPLPLKPQDDVRPIGVVPTVPDPGGEDSGDEEEEATCEEDMQQAAALLAFCDRKRDKDERMARWRARWGD